MAKLNARIKHLHATADKWNSNAFLSFVPATSEIIVYDPDAEHIYPRFKIGDGVTTVQDLPFFIDDPMSQRKGDIAYVDGGEIVNYLSVEDDNTNSPEDTETVIEKR